MDYWEFLLQQEGDSSWLPLESSQVEILEGRYRIMAYTSQLNQPVQVRISQLLLQHSPPKRRSLKRTSQTRDNGLMVVMPFTWLTAGIWEVDCSQVTPADAAAPWRYQVQLRVLPQESGEDGGWFADDGSMAAASLVAPDLAVPAEAAAADPDRPLALTPEQLEQILVAAAAADDPSALAWPLQLTPSALVGSKGQVLTLTGQVDDAAAAAYPGGHLIWRLSDPQNGQPVLVSHHPIPAASAPVPFAIELRIPPRLDTRLLLGEAVLAQGQTGQLQGMARFTVTIDLADLFDIIANQAESQPDFDIVFPGEGAAEADDGRLADQDASSGKTVNPAMPRPPARAIPSVTLPKDRGQLPPRIYYPSPHEAAARQPALPPLADSGRSTAGMPPATPSDTAATPPTGKAEVPPQAEPPAAAISLPTFVRPRPGQAGANPANAGSTAAPGQGAPSAPPALPSHEAAAFRSLNLQDRFWSRLTALAVDIQQAAQQQVESDPADLPDPPSTDDGEPAAPADATSFPGEVVIYDDPAAATDDPRATTATAAASMAAAEPAADEAISPPAPLLEVPDGELTAGEPVLINLRVPFHPNRLYLKVWMTDPQTRTLADEPRQLMHLAPDGSGHLAGAMQLTVPLGCLELWFEAIAVDMITQQESYKAMVARSVKPADLSDPGLDDFDL